MAPRKPVPVSPYDIWLKEMRDVHTDAVAAVERIDREIAEKSAEIDALFAERTEQMALRDHVGTAISLDPSEYREKTKHGAWQLVKHKPTT